jgi:hypothetical protein
MERKKEATKPNSSASNNAHTTITTSLTFSRSLLPLSLSLSLSSLALLAVNIFCNTVKTLQCVLGQFYDIAKVAIIRRKISPKWRSSTGNVAKVAIIRRKI